MQVVHRYRCVFRKGALTVFSREKKLHILYVNIHIQFVKVCDHIGVTAAQNTVELGLLTRKLRPNHKA